jgi:hypothetical protein
VIGERLADLVAIADDDTLVDAGLVLAECARQLRALAGKPDPVAALSRDRPSGHSPRKPPLAGTREICADHRMRGPMHGRLAYAGEEFLTLLPMLNAVMRLTQERAETV